MANLSTTKLERSNSISQASQSSQTAQEFINSQLQLEADAREALPYQFDTCTRPLGPLRQSLFSCLTCNPPPKDAEAPYQAAGVCYSCSISCHGEHELVELFNKRNFVCDCGTKRLPSTSPCSLRINQETGTKGNVHSETPAGDNKYNHNFRNNFCTCGEVYNAQQEQGTMFQCLGLGTVETGGCGEDWYHPECLMGLSRDWRTKKNKGENNLNGNESITIGPIQDSAAGDVAQPGEPPAVIAEAVQSNLAASGIDNYEGVDGQQQDDIPPGFPDEDDFEDLICYKCVDANPWIKKYAYSTGFQAAIVHQSSDEAQPSTINGTTSRKRKSSPDQDEQLDIQNFKKPRSQGDDAQAIRDESQLKADTTSSDAVQPPCIYDELPVIPEQSVSLFTKEDFRTQICRCPKCYPAVARFPQLLEEEDTYEPPVSEEGDDGGAGSLGSRSLLDRGEAALSNVDRVRAIEGVMVYNHLKDKVKSFLKPFAESGQPVGAEDIKKYFEGLRGDSEGISAAARQSNGNDAEGSNGDNRREQSGY